MADARMSGFLPTIKCSMCAREIEISMMGEHVCSAPAEPTPPLESYGRFDNPYKQQPTNGPPLLKPGRMAPPRVDTSAANRPFFRQDQMTPVSASSESRSISPRTPNDGRRSPFGMRPREAMRPPSPEILSSNLDSAFPPFPAPKQASKKSSRLNKDIYAGPDSGRTGNGPSPVLQRMNTIAPGPFDINGRPGRRLHTPEPDSRRNEGQQLQTHSPAHSRSTTSSSDERPMTGARIPQVERTGGYGGFGPPIAEPEQKPLQAENRSQTFPKSANGRPQPEQKLLQAENRSNTFPMNSGGRPPVGLPRRPSEPNNPPRKPSSAGSSGSTSVSPPRQRRPSMSGPDRSRPLPPRGTSLIRQREGKAGDAPPLPDLAAEFGASNPYHTPSASESSTSSTGSRPSPERVGRRKPSDTSKIDIVMQDIQATMAKDLPSEQFAKPLAPFSRTLLSPESPMDPAIQGGRLSPLPPRSKTPADPQRRPTTAKGNCKGCGEAIKGKSVSSADGRLTGRYHKQCFVCKTCNEPFATATFYVIDNAPYCERHYHKLNGSMCHSCDKGIEGQYLETERKQKYHPTCLTCTDCRKVLRDDYFETNGKVYCERDAYRKAQQRNFLGTNRMERRTTRLMMM